MGFLSNTGAAYLVQKIMDILDSKADTATTISGYGITDAYTKTESDSALSTAISNLSEDYYTKSEVYTMEETESLLTNQAYTKTEMDNKFVDYYTANETDTAIENAVDSAISGVYKFKGSITFASIPTANNTVGDVYNIKDDFTTTAAFITSGEEYPAGTNIAYTDSGWDVLAGAYDLSIYLTESDLEEITTAEIDAMFE